MRPFIITLGLAILSAFCFAAGQGVAQKEAAQEEAAQKELTQEDIERIDDKVRDLLDAMGAKESAAVGIEQMLSAFKQMPGLPKDFLEEFKAAVDVDEIVELSVPVYRKHLQEKTIDAVLKFTATPEGEAFFSKQPSIVEESMILGQKWGQEKALEVMESLGK